MNVKGFRAARKEFLDSCPFSDAKKYHRIILAIKKAAKPEHVYENIGMGITDKAQCSCGWVGEGFWDGAEDAFKSWREHVADVMGLTEKKCPCGKKYLPVDGGKPCHELRPIKN